jgi:poly-gamma-glutamate capsule biosynthesis protein CapA/YwtB (metallophosphatase superfamily)
MTVTLGLMGDVMIGRLVNEFLDIAPAYAIWGDLLDELHATDLNLINLELAFTKCNEAVQKTFNFKADPDKVQSLVEGRVDVVNLANNHILDYTTKGLFETLFALNKAHILHVGAGKHLSEARQPVIVTRRGIKIGILGATDNEPSWGATEHKPGVRYLKVNDLESALSDIIPLKNQVDLLIFSYHWGPNMRQVPTENFVHFAHQLIDHGVDIFHGHSAHVFQGVEEYKKGLILYDTGDFIDDYAVDPLLRNDQSFLFLVEASKAGYQKLRMIPTEIRGFCAHRAKEKAAEEIQARMEDLSKQITALPVNRP